MNVSMPGGKYKIELIVIEGRMTALLSNIKSFLWLWWRMSKL
jgi:hypothetical protein